MRKKYFAVLIVALVISLIVSGCVAPAQQAAPAEPTVTHTAPPTTLATPQTLKITPTAQTPHPRVTIITTAPPTPATTTPTQAASTGPLATPVTLTGTAGKIVWFDAVAPGEVKITMHYGDAPKSPGCTDSQLSLKMAGRTMDSDLNIIKWGGATTQKLPEAGRYSLAFAGGCYSWKIKVENA